MLDNENFFVNNFKYPTASSGTVMQKFIYQTLSGMSHTDLTCSVACFARTTTSPPCHFFSRDANNYCLLGNLFQVTNYTNGAALTVILNESE